MSAVLLDEGFRAAQARAVPQAAYKAEVAWGQGTEGLFTFGVSQFGSLTDLLAATSWSTGFTGTYDNLGQAPRDVSVQRGRDNDLSTMQAGQIVLGLRDASGTFNPRNASSPLAGYLDTDKPVRVSAAPSGGVYSGLGYGFITDIEADAAGRGTCQITAIDFLDKLDRQSPILTGLAPGLTTGQIIGLILDWFKWTDPTMRVLATGDVINAAYTRADGSRSGLALIAELLDAERGLLFVNRFGQVVYIDRKGRASQTSLGSLDRVMTAFPVARSNANIVNQWTVQRTDMNDNNVGVAQVWPSSLSASQKAHGTVAQTLSTPFLNSDAQALYLAQFLVLRTQQSLAGVYDVPLDIPDTATLLQVLSRDIGDRVTLTVAPRNMPQFTSDFYIESLSHTVATAPGSPRHTCQWRVSEAAAYSAFRFGFSQFGGSGLLYY